MRYYLDSNTGVINSEDDWVFDYLSKTHDEWGSNDLIKSSFIEVIQDDNGNWIEL